jgi:hypothetical protein
MSLESEINQAVNEQLGEESQPSAEDKKLMVLPVSGLINSVFLYLSKDWDDEDRQKLILDDMESENVNEMLTPMILKIAEKLGLAVEELAALIGLTGLILPRIFIYMGLRKKYSDKKGEKQSGDQGEKEADS